MKQKINDVIQKNEWLLPLSIFLLFLAVSLPGVSWGAPALWNPDELIWRVDSALRGEMVFDVSEPDFNYPSLPKYVMYAIGSLVYGTGHSSFAFIVAARSFSCLLGASVVVLIYSIARMMGANKRTSTLAGILYVVSGVAAANGRFAHNDLYLQFFTVLCLYFVIRFQYARSLGWLYASFLAVGMAASSKYTGVSMVLLPIGVFGFVNGGSVLREWLNSLKSLFIGALLVVAGYVIGTPRLLLSPMDYLGSAIPAALRFSQYGYNSGTQIGLYGQWGVFEDAVGGFAYYLFLIGFIWFTIRLLLHWLGKAQMDAKLWPGVFILVMNLVIFDLPFLISINYIPRHFIPFVPLFAILGALFIDEVVAFAKNHKLRFVPPAINVLFTVGVTYSLLRLVSIALLFTHDARIPASEYIAGIRGYGKSIEYTLYPPVIEKSRFFRAHNYPIYFLKYKDDAVPTGGRFEYNLGEEGLISRDTDYFVVDSYTYERFASPSECEANKVECDFFNHLLANEDPNFHLLKEFTYHLPSYLPQVAVSAVNPEIRIYERVR
ncbi:MAG: phospholipid carrier-dependent glycosyltransferase [Anaerolineales bacterium]